MICPACSCENDPHRAVCESCGARAISNSAPPSALAERSYEEQIADLDRHIAELSQRLQAAHTVRAAIAEVIGQSVAHQAQAHDVHLPHPTIDVGPLRLTVGAPHGSAIEPVPDTPATGALRSPNEPACALPDVDVRTSEAAAIWEALDHGAPIVRISAQPGAGTSALLRQLAVGAREHGFGADALSITGARGPAADVERSLQPLREGGADPVLVLLDRADLSAADQMQLVERFPHARFVLTDASPPPGTPSVALGPLKAGDALTLAEAGYGRSVERDDRCIVLDFCATAGFLPGPVVLFGVAARNLRRSFISLRLQFDTASDVSGEFVKALPAEQRRLLAALALAATPLGAKHIERIVAGNDAGVNLESLVEYQLVRRCGTDLYELPSYVADVVPPIDDRDAVLARVMGVLSDLCDRHSVVAALDRQLAAAERVLEAAAQREQWGAVLMLGPRLADAFASRGALGAWGRVLATVEIAATRAGDAAALDRTRHELGVRALLEGERNAATTFLRSAVRGRKAAGDTEGAAATTAVLALSDQAANAGVAQAAPHGEVGTVHPPLKRRSRRGMLARRVLLMLALCIAAAVISALSLTHRSSAAPAIVGFSAEPIAVTSGGLTQLCVEARDMAVVELFPDAGRLPGAGRHCVAVKPSATTTYYAVGTSFDGRQVRRAATVLVQMAGPSRPLRILAFSAQPARIAAGGSTQLCYAVTGADVLRIVPRVGELTRLRSCTKLRLREPHRYTYKLAAAGDDGQFAVRHAYVDVVPARASTVTGLAARKTDRGPVATRLTRHAIFQFDATPRIVERGQSISLCVGIDRPARGFVTHVGPLKPGITRCYRVVPRATTVYRLYVALESANAVETVTVAVRAPLRRRDVARTAVHP